MNWTRNTELASKIENINHKKCDIDWCDFSKESALKEDLLLKIKHEYFSVFQKAQHLTDDELELVNAAEKPRFPCKPKFGEKE